MDMSKVFVHCLVGVLSLRIINQIAGYEANSRHCPSTQCGNLTIPFPFGSQGCNLSTEFLITCDNSSNQQQAFLTTSNIKVTKISLNGELEIMQSVTGDCYEQSGDPDVKTNSQYVNPSWITLSKFKISKSRNKFTVVGCDSYAYLRGYRDKKLYSAGCMSTCSASEFVDTTSCSGSGCCQIEIGDGLYEANVTAYSFRNHTQVWNHSRCTFAFLVEENKFKFSHEHLKEVRTELPLVLDWGIDNTTTKERRIKLSNACGDHAFSYYPTHDQSRYLCKCEHGYSGNPYLGCEDINECETNNHNCTHVCLNLNGSYTCACPPDYIGDGRKYGAELGCVKKSILLKIVIGVGGGLVFLLGTSSWLYIIIKQRKLLNLKEKFFLQNGGIILRQKLSSSKHEGASDTAKIFTAEELKKATDNFHSSKIIGRGGFGTVFKGILSDKRVVAIKKSVKVDATQNEQFINEVIVLSQISHRNVVKLLGCCLETEVPLLVYEFIDNGTLCNHIHDQSIASNLTWPIRLRIAAETAGALSYLHSGAEMPIIHRDVKTANVLLDANYTAKVSDFGASRLVPVEEMHLTTIVQGTLGYLDPEYMHTSQLTEKSDVYSFGVVLVEMLTCQIPLSFSRPEEERNLAVLFLSSLKEGHLFEIVDKNIVNDENKEQIMEVAKLARRCLSLTGEDRPSMKEVEMELLGLQKEMHAWVQEYSEDTEHLLKEQYYSNALGYGKAHTSSSCGYDSIKDHLSLSVGDGR